MGEDLAEEGKTSLNLEMCDRGEGASGEGGTRQGQGEEAAGRVMPGGL